MCQSLFQHALFHSLGTLARILAVVAIHFRPYPHKLRHDLPTQLILELSNDLLVGRGEEWVVSWVVRGVVVTDVGLHVCGDVVGCHVNDDRICVGVQESDVVGVELL